MASMKFSIMKLAILFFIKTKAKTHKKIPEIPAIFTFGDSSLDSGNNNYISSVAKADNPPYGQDLPTHTPRGRFSNGKLLSDFFASDLGIKNLIPPFLDPNLSENELVTGVSFASGGSGFDEVTALKTNSLSIPQQLGLFKKYISRIHGIVGEKKAKKIIRNALVLVSSGPNDWIFNFYDFPSTKRSLNATYYSDFLLDKAKNFFEELRDLGCRRIVATGLPPIGRLPVQIMGLDILNKNYLKSENLNSQFYNKKLKKLLKHLEAKHPDTKFLYMDAYYLLLNMIIHPRKYGFVNSREGCFGAVPFKNTKNQIIPLCKNSSEYLFWDSVHITQAGHHHMAIITEKVIFPKL